MHLARSAALAVTIKSLDYGRRHGTVPGSHLENLQITNQTRGLTEFYCNTNRLEPVILSLASERKQANSLMKVSERLSTEVTGFIL